VYDEPADLGSQRICLPLSLPELLRWLRRSQRRWSRT